VPNQNPAPTRPDFEGMKWWCSSSRTRCLIYGLVPLAIGLTSTAAAFLTAPDNDLQMLFGAAVSATSVFPGKQYLDRSDWLQGITLFKERWDILGKDPKSTARDFARLRAKLDSIEGHLVGRAQ